MKPQQSFGFIARTLLGPSYSIPILTNGLTHPHSANPLLWSSSQRCPCGQMSVPMSSVVQFSNPWVRRSSFFMLSSMLSSQLGVYWVALYPITLTVLYQHLFMVVRCAGGIVVLRYNWRVVGVHGTNCHTRIMNGQVLKLSCIMMKFSEKI
jgi:hypothetical protein